MFDISSHSQLVTHLPSLQNALLLGRGGAVLLASAVASSSIGEGRSDGPSSLALQLAVSGGSTSSSTTTSLFTPEGKSVLFMAIAMAFHYLGYSLARSITVSLFTSSVTGYAGSAAAFPFAMAFVSPVALLMLMGYTNVLERKGPRGALIQSTLFCAVVVNFSALAIATCLKTGYMVAGIPAVKLISGPLFIFRESYVQLLTSQYWSFMASALTPNQAAKWFGPIAGLTSISSAVAGMAVSPLVRSIGLPGTLMGTGTMLLLSLVAASMAYKIAREHGFEPSDVDVNSKGTNKKKTTMDVNVRKMGMAEKAKRLFVRVPVLKALFLEILASQGLATVLNVCFVTRLGTAIPNDAERAGWLGKFFALINVITMFLQFGVLPRLMSVIEPKDLWRVIPVVSLLFTGFQAFHRDPSLYIVSASLLVMKVSEYSARRMLDEMIFVPLDFESRFLGKEVIGVFGYRFGKSLMSLVLSGFASVDANFGLQKLSIISNLMCFSWMNAAWKLSNMVPTREEAEASFQKDKKRKR